MSPVRDELLDHDYDGIQEYDNPIPQWMNLIFLASVVFAIGYAFWFHWGGPGKSIAEQYAEAKAAHAKQSAALHPRALSASELFALTKKSDVVARGKKVFAQYCTPCHGPNGEGKIGPNLTDDAWIHGGRLSDIYKTVSEGVLDKGMPAWGKQLKPDDLQAVVAYVGTLRGKNLPGKAPQGTKVTLQPGE